MSHRPPSASSGEHDNPHAWGSRDWKDWNAEAERMRNRKQQEEWASWQTVLEKPKPSPPPVPHTPAPPVPKPVKSPAKIAKPETKKPPSEKPWSNVWAFLGLLVGGFWASSVAEGEGAVFSIALGGAMGAAVFGRFYRVIVFLIVVGLVIWYFESGQ